MRPVVYSRARLTLVVRSIAFLRRAFSPVFTLHSVTRTGELQLTTRWTMEMRVSAGPLAALWAPRLVFTGTSELSVSPEGLFTQHVDYWDSVDDNRYLSLEAVGDLFAQLASLQRTPELESPAYTPLLRRRQYEVRRYAACAEIVRALPPGTGPAGDGGGFNSLAGYIFGGNASGERLEMTTPVLNRVAADGAAQMAFPVFSDAPLPEPRAGSGVQRGEAPARVAVRPRVVLNAALRARALTLARRRPAASRAWRATRRRRRRRRRCARRCCGTACRRGRATRWRVITTLSRRRGVRASGWLGGAHSPTHAARRVSSAE